MTSVPVHPIDLSAFWRNPYPELARMRAQNPVCHVPQLGATLMVKRDDIFICEKNTDVFSSHQPGGLMTELMGENMMRKDGEAHLLERKQSFPALSPRTVRDVWLNHFKQDCAAVIETLSARRRFDLVQDYAMPVSANALRRITGLTCMTTQQMDDASQGMIDGIGNYAGDAAIEERCHAATRLVDDAIDTMTPKLADHPDSSLLNILHQSDQPEASIRANVKLAISGGQNEPRDAIAGCAWALLTHPEQRADLLSQRATYLQAFEEYARWISPIGMSPRRIAKKFVWNGVELEPDTRLFFMFGSANRDEDVFDNANQFDIHRNTAKAVSFGAGPHFCAGAAASRSLIADVALPQLFTTFPNLRLDGAVEFGGWAFRGPLSVPVRID